MTAMDHVKKHIQENDRFAREVGIQLIEASDGSARAELTVEPRHFNSKGMVHGGALFTLADLAFAAACNSRGQVAVAVNATMAFVKAVDKGKLVAEARELAFHPKLATYMVTVTDEGGEPVAVFQGTAYRKKESWGS
jgi:acyl-CoA thioesterase